MPQAGNEKPALRWFQAYVDELEKSLAASTAAWRGYWLCPCCRLPTLPSRRDFEICWLCDWEDDGQDNHNADKVLGGPNRDYSLTEARLNFTRYLTMYRPSHSPAFARSTVKKGFGGVVRRDLAAVKQQIVAKYAQAMQAAEPAVVDLLLQEISQLRILLR
jgi:Cysteine-rich CPCC